MHLNWLGQFPTRQRCVIFFTSARYEDLVIDNDDHDWIVVPQRKKKKKKKTNVQSILSCFKGTNNKPLTRKERRRKQQAKAIYKPIHIPDVPGRTELDLSAEFLEAMKNIPKIEHYTSTRCKGCQMKTKRVIQ
jgi:hypothetical protein